MRNVKQEVENKRDFPAPKASCIQSISIIYGSVRANVNIATSGFKGNMIFSIRQGSFENLYYIRIKDLKK